MSEVKRFRMSRRRRSRRRDRRRAIYLLPNLITSAALLFGFWSIIESIGLNFERAALLIILAAISDMLDGRIARATRSTSPFGVEYDSLSDMLSFGIAPAILVYNWALIPLGNRSWLIAALFALCAALRLARFNIKGKVRDGTHYQGLPSTIAGSFVAVTVWFIGWLGLEPPFSRPLSLALTTGFATLALLMVSAVPYPSWQLVRINRRQAYPALVAVVLATVAIGLHHEPLLFALGATFVLLGPALWLLDRRKPRESKLVSEEMTTESGEDAG